MQHDYASIVVKLRDVAELAFRGDAAAIASVLFLAAAEIAHDLDWDDEYTAAAIAFARAEIDTHRRRS